MPQRERSSSRRRQEAAMTADAGHAIVPVLACVLQQLCLRNDSLPLNRKQVSKFHSLRPPGIAIPTYLARIEKYAACSGECFVLALVYIDRIIQSNPTFVVNSLNIHRLLITSVMLAAKFFDDQYFNNSYYAKVGGVPCAEINSLEVEFLFMTNFTLFVSTETYRQYYSELCNHAMNSNCGCAQQNVPPLLYPFGEEGAEDRDEDSENENSDDGREDEDSLVEFQNSPYSSARLRQQQTTSNGGGGDGDDCQGNTIDNNSAGNNNNGQNSGSGDIRYSKAEHLHPSTTPTVKLQQHASELTTTKIPGHSSSSSSTSLSSPPAPISAAQNHPPLHHQHHYPIPQATPAQYQQQHHHPHYHQQQHPQYYHQHQSHPQQQHFQHNQHYHQDQQQQSQASQQHRFHHRRLASSSSSNSNPASEQSGQQQSQHNYYHQYSRSAVDL